MTAFIRGIQAYLLLIAFLATLAIVWGTNGVLLDNTAAATGWPLLIGTSGVLVVLGALLRHRRATNDGDPTLSPYPWSSDERQ